MRRFKYSSTTLSVMWLKCKVNSPASVNVYQNNKIKVTLTKISSMKHSSQLKLWANDGLTFAVVPLYKVLDKNDCGYTEFSIYYTVFH